MLRRCAQFIDRWHWLILLLAGPFMVFPALERIPVLLVVPLVWGIGWIARPRAPLPSTPLNTLMLVLMIMVLVSVVVTPDLAFSMHEVAGMVLAFGIFFGAAREARRPLGLWLLLALFLAIGLAIAAFSLVNTNWPAKIGFLASVASHLPPRLVGVVGIEGAFNPNQMAGSLLWVAPVLICLPVGLVMAVRPRASAAAARPVSRLVRVFLIALVLISAIPVLGVLLLAQSRGAYLALTLVLTGIVFLALPRRGRWVMAIVLVIAIVAASVLIWQRRDTFGQQLSFVLDVEPAAGTDTSTGSLNTLDGRLEIWSRAIYGIEDFPFTGMGMNSFRRVVNLLYPLFLTSPDTDIAHAHNEFLQAALDLGIPGMIAFGALYLVALWMLRRVWLVSTGDALTRALALGLGGGLYAHCVFGMTDAVALGAKPGALFWLLLGLICGLFAQHGGSAVNGISSSSVTGTAPLEATHAASAVHRPV
ncbi:MAG: O-antigen ligase family protein [Chloroflexi bacterium]|nr:O-antigen ligase family protein [Chloroflexota bacterium]MCL5275022.1 O-antigen ligase family protein [Chloroflexota bacterium]